jgi:hypothetical protein
VIEAASPFADLVFHVLAFVPAPPGGSALSRAASLHWPAWIRLAAERLPPDAVEPARRDAALLSAMLADDRVAATIQVLALLHDEPASAAAAALRSVRALGAGDVASAWARAELARLPEEPVEILRIAVALCAADFDREHAALLAPYAAEVVGALRPRLADLAARVPAVGRARLRFSTTLGPRGRGMDRAVFVGTSTLPGDATVDLDTPLVYALHETAVLAAEQALGRGTGRWALVERVALEAEKRVVVGTALEGPHASWLERLDDAGLVRPDAADQGAVLATVEALRSRVP